MRISALCIIGSLTAGLVSTLILLVSLDWKDSGQSLLEHLEGAIPAADLTGPYQVSGIIALGGNFARYEFALDIARRFPEAKILISIDGPPVARLLSTVNARNIPENRVILERKSRTTAENAVFAAQLLNPRDEQTWILVTDSWHMPRAVGVFERAGFRVLPAPLFSRNDSQPPHPMENAFKEWCKLIYYRLIGRTDALVPRLQKAPPRVGKTSRDDPKVQDDA